MLCLRFCICILLLSESIFAHMVGKDDYQGQSRGTKKVSKRKPNKNSTNILPATPNIESTPIIETTATLVEDFTTRAEEPPATTFPTEEPMATSITEEPTTTACHDSSYTREDLNVIFDMMINEMKVPAHIKEMYILDAQNIRDKYLKALENFRQIFQARPNDLLPIITGVQTLREKLLEPLVNKASTDSEQLSMFEAQFAAKQKTYQNLVNQYYRQRKICELACETTPYLDNRMAENKRYLGNTIEETKDGDITHYCGTYNEIRNKINTTLTNFTINTQNALKEKMLEDDTTYDKEIELIQNKLKAKAYNDFQNSVYGILKIQSEYGVLNVTIKSMDFKEVLDNITHNLALIDPGLVTLRIRIGDLARHCRNCRDEIVPRSLHYNEGRSRNLLDEVIETQLKSLETSIKKEYTTLYLNLTEAMEEAASGSYMEVFKEIHERVDAAIKDQISQVESLKNNFVAVQKVFFNFINMVDESKHILVEIDKDINFIDNFIRQ